LKAREFLPIVALGLAVTAPLTAAAAAPSERVAVIVAPASSAVFRSPRAAHGLLVVGAGSTVTRRAALANLLAGKLGQSNIGAGLPGGKPAISLARRPARVTFYVALPPPGRHHNVRRYPIAVVGPGYRGLLTDTSTRLPGLVSIANVAPSAKALASGERPRIRSTAESDPLARLARFDRRLDQAHATRDAMSGVIAGLVLVLALLWFATHAPALARATFLAPGALVAAAVALSAAGVASPWTVGTAVGLIGAAAALAGGAFLPPRLPLAVGLAALFAFLFAVMWARPEWNALAVIGPHPDGGGRFYGVTNEVETILLAPALVLGALAGALLVPVALLVAAGIAVSRIGADGGGLVVYLAGFLVLWIRLRHVPARRALAATAAVAAAAVLLVGIDAATGGSSHVTHAVGGGPGSLLGDLGHRLHLSVVSIGLTWNNALLFSFGIVALVLLALAKPRYAVLDAYLVAIAVSLLVNDTPTDVAGYGGLCALGIWLFARSDDPRRSLQ
jgi:hypothetical protein